VGSGERGVGGAGGKKNLGIFFNTIFCKGKFEGIVNEQMNDLSECNRPQTYHYYTLCTAFFCAWSATALVSRRRLPGGFLNL
jgi:hypothetical protein